MKVKKLNTLLEVLQGVAFKEKITPVYFETRWGVHTFFVKQPIDVFICDDHLIVVKIKRGLKPWRIFTWNPMYKIVIETPPNHKLYKNIKEGSKIPLQ